MLLTEVNLPIAQLVSMGLEYIRLSDELSEVLAEVRAPEFDRAMAGPDGRIRSGQRGRLYIDRTSDRPA
jgi:hypothetical protein